jgi:hypothetical protein
MRIVLCGTRIRFRDDIDLPAFRIWTFPSFAGKVSIDLEVHAAAKTSDGNLHDSLTGTGGRTKQKYTSRHKPKSKSDFFRSHRTKGSE